MASNDGVKWTIVALATAAALVICLGVCMWLRARGRSARIRDVPRDSWGTLKANMQGPVDVSRTSGESLRNLVQRLEGLWWLRYSEEVREILSEISVQLRRQAKEDSMRDKGGDHQWKENRKAVECADDSCRGYATDWMDVLTSTYQSLHQEPMDDEGDTALAVAPPPHRPAGVGSVNNLAVYELGQDTQAELRRHLVGLLEWDFDVFAVSQLVGQHKALSVIAMEVLLRLGVVSTLEVSESSLFRWVQRIAELYSPTNLYHGGIHGSDVCQAVAALLVQDGMKDSLGPEELCALAIAALVHDVHHPGVGNAFLVKTRHHLAITYNDQSVLENMHCSVAFQAMQDFPWLESTKAKTMHPSIRKHAIELVLATDMESSMAFQAKFNSHFNQCLEEAAQDGKSDQEASRTACSLTSHRVSSSEDTKFYMTMLLKCCDIGHPAKQLHLHEQWTERLTEEFFLQGDTERSLGFPVSPLIDRLNARPLCVSQIGFLDFVCKPMYASFASVSQFFSTIPQAHVTSNYNHWVQIRSGLEEAKEESKPDGVKNL